MPQQKQICFDENRLQEFLDETTDETMESEVLQHIGSCKKCQATMERLAARNEVWSDIKQNLDEKRLNAIGCETEDLVAEDLSRDVTFIKDLLAPTDDPTKMGRLGIYEVCGIIGRGSAGIVVKALDTRLHRFVAIKILAPVYSSNGSARRRFEREGRSIASVQDDHIIPVYTVDEYKGNPFIVMQYVPDGSLLQRIERTGPLEQEEVVCVAMQIAKGLSAAHNRGIVHRDVKPANVLLAGGVDRAMVTDFGLARVVDEATMTRSGAISGTPQYMSPEQAKGESLDQRSDLFSLGSVMYAACTGRSPFRSETVFGVIKRVCESEPRPIREINPKIDEWLEQFIQKLHAKDPGDRFNSSQQVSDLLFKELTFMQSPTLAERPQRTWAPVKPKEQTDWAKIGLITTAIAALALLIGSWQMGASNLASQASGWFGMSGLFQSNQDEDKELPRFENTTVTTIDVKKNGTLAFRTNLGQLEVKTHDRPIVEMTLTHIVEAETEEDAAKFFRAVDLKYDLDEKEIADLNLRKKRDAAIVATFATQNMAGKEIEDNDDLDTVKEKLLLGNSNNHHEARFVLLVPESFDLNLKTDNGEISIANIDGNIKLESKNGPIETLDVTGSVDISTAAGHIAVGNIESDATLKTNGGHIETGNIEGDLMARTLGGHIEVGEVEGTADISSNGGHITIERSEDFITAQTTGGEIRINRAEEACKLNSSAGNIQVYFVDQPSSDSELVSRAGNVRVGMSREMAFNISSSTGNGSVQGPFIEGRPKNFELALNDGESGLSAKTGNGNIEFFFLKDSVDGRLHHRFPSDEEDYDAFDIAFRYHKEGELDDALKAYEDAISKEVREEVATFNIGCIWAEKGEAEKAFASLDEAITLGFRDLDQFEFDADLESLRSDSRFEKLITRIKSFEELGDTLYRGHNQVAKEKYADAVKSFRTVLEMEPEHEEAIFYLGYALHLNGDIEEALAYHQRATAFDNFAALGNYNSACVYALQGKTDKAFKTLEEAVKTGFYDVEHMNQDSDLDSLREDERYREIIESIERDKQSECSTENECEACPSESKKQKANKSIA